MSCNDEQYNFGNAGFGTENFGNGQSPALDNQDELELYQILQTSLPSWLFADCPQEIWYQLTKQWGLIKANIVDQDLRRTYILQAEGIWLNQHARDRGTYRQPFETDDTLRTRLRYIPDTVNGNSLVFDGSLYIYDGYTDTNSFSASYLCTFQSQLNQMYVVGTIDYSGNSLNDAGHPKEISWRSLGAGTYYLYRTATDAYGGVGLIGTTDGTTAYEGYGVPDGYGNILDEGLTILDIGQTATGSVPDTSPYTIPDLGIVKKILNNGDGFGAYDCTGNYPGLVELGLDQMFYGDNSSILPDGFYGRGERMWDKRSAIVIILPYSAIEGYPPSIVDGVLQATNRIKAAGTIAFVEAWDGIAPSY